MVILRNVKLCTATIVYWCQKLMLYFLCSMGKNWFFYAESFCCYLGFRIWTVCVHLFDIHLLDGTHLIFNFFVPHWFSSSYSLWLMLQERLPTFSIGPQGVQTTGLAGLPESSKATNFFQKLLLKSLFRMSSFLRADGFSWRNFRAGATTSCCRRRTFSPWRAVTWWASDGSWTQLRTR